MVIRGAPGVWDLTFEKTLAALQARLVAHCISLTHRSGTKVSRFLGFSSQR